MDKGQVLSRLRQIRYPADLRDTPFILEGVIPDLQYVDVYPSARYTDPEAWEREDRVVLVTSRLLLVCEARSRGFEMSSPLGTTRQSFDWFMSSIRTAPLAEIEDLKIGTQQGGVSVRSTSQRIINLTLGHARSGIDLVLPFAGDLGGRDQNDIEAVYARLEDFADSLLHAVDGAGT